MIPARVALAIVTLAAATACDPGEREAQPFVGRWESAGYGLFLDIHGGRVDIYEHTAAHCQQVAASAARGISEVMSLDAGALVLRDAGRTVRFRPLDSLPLRCADPVDGDDAAATFAVAAATVSEQYFPQPDAAWETARAEITGTLDADATAVELFDALVALLGALGDPELRLALDADGLPESWSVEAGGLGAALAAHPAARQLDGGVITRVVADGVGYLGIVRLAAGTGDEQRILAGAIDEVLSGAGGLVIDLRGASGGIEEAALLVATRFVPAESAVAVVLARDGDGLVPSGEFTVTPVPTGHFAGPIVVLVGPATSGAGELLALVLADLPQVTLVGEPTAGSPRAPLVRLLPNGWSLGVPNLEVLDAAGVARVGVPLEPDVEALTTPEDVIAGEDPGLEAALTILSWQAAGSNRRLAHQLRSAMAYMKPSSVPTMITPAEVSAGVERIW